MVRKTKINPKRIIYDKSDSHKTFTTDAALHIINKTSVEDLERRMMTRYPDGLEHFYVSIEQFRANIVLDTKLSYSEDNYNELRAGAILMRNCGPCIRCNTIRMNLDKHCPVDENEPYNTLGTFRTCPGLGVMFGMYYQMEILSNKRLYNKVLPQRLGYSSFEEAIKRNPIEKREADGEYYIRIHKEDGLAVRFD